MKMTKCVGGNNSHRSKRSLRTLNNLTKKKPRQQHKNLQRIRPQNLLPQPAELKADPIHTKQKPNPFPHQKQQRKKHGLRPLVHREKGRGRGIVQNHERGVGVAGIGMKQGCNTIKFGRHEAAHLLNSSSRLLLETISQPTLLKEADLCEIMYVFSVFHTYVYRG